MNITIKAKKVTLDERTEKYVQSKIGDLDKFLTRADRDTAKADVILKRVDREHGNKYEAEVTLNVGREKYEAKDSTLNVLAAIDIVRAKLMNQLKNAKDQRLPKR